MDEAIGGATGAAQDETGGAGMSAASGTGPQTGTATEAAAVRTALLAAYPRTVPELVGGESVGEVLASLEVARAAWERVEAAVAAEPAGATAADEGAVARVAGGAVPAVPAGAGLAAAVDPERLPTTEKIRRGLVARGA